MIRQIDDAERGFSFRSSHAGRLDMRMSGISVVKKKQKTTTKGNADEELSAYDVINYYQEAELAEIIRKYGEERRAKQIARAIARRRSIKPIETTQQLAEIIRSVFPQKGESNIDPSTRTFQALRIVVNDELTQLQNGLQAAEELLLPGGRLAGNPNQLET